MEISSEVVSSANVSQHCAIIKEKSLLRSLIGSATRILEKAYDGSQDPANHGLGRRRNLCHQRDHGQAGIYSIKRILKRHLQADRKLFKGEIIGVPTGFKDSTP